MINPAESGQGKLFLESLEVMGEQGDATDKQYVFPRQCLVLGDSEVGKTSLVNSLTGKPFDPNQPKTQGIDQCLVDNQWKNCNLKDLVFGDLWKFFKSGLVEVFLSTPGRATRNVAQEFMFNSMKFLPIFGIWIFIAFFVTGLSPILYHFPVTSLLIFFIFIGHLFFQYCTIHCSSASNLRFISATIVFILNRQGMFSGICLAVVICYFKESPIDFANILTLGAIAGIAFVALFILIGPIQMPSGTGQLLKSQNFGVILCFYRTLLSMLIGLIFGFAVVILVVSEFEKNSFIETSITPMKDMLIRKLACMFSPICFFSLAEVDIHLIQSIISSMKDGSWGPCNILLMLAVFYHCKLSFTSPMFYCVNILFPLSICFTFCIEWFRIHSKRNISECLSDNYMTLTLKANGEVDTRMLKSALNEKYPSLKLQILDFAGDKEYYAYHHMFLKRQAIYIIVFNIAKHVENNFGTINVAIERLQFWLESVCSHVPPKTPIFLVGTHTGDLDKICMRILNGHFMKHLWDPYCDELVINDANELVFFPVENSKGENDVGVQSLQLTVMSVAAEERKTAKDCDIPLSWITIKDAIINQREKEKAKFCVTLEEFPTAFGNFICTNWSEETLKYFHEKGLVIYLDKDPELSKWVLLKPEILVNIIIRLVTSSPEMNQERGFRRDWKLLHDKGVLTKSLLIRIISTVQENEEAMTAFLEEYNLICPLSNNKVKMCSISDDEEHQATHFVPSLLQMSLDGSIPAWHDNTTDKKFYVFFKRFLPEPLFHRGLLSRAHKNSKLEFPNGPVVMFKDVGKFWMSPWQPYRLKLMKEEAIIEVTFTSR